MSEYRAYFVGADGHFDKFKPLDCDNDTVALEAGFRLLDGHNIEIWQGDRRVIQLEHPTEHMTAPVSEAAALRSKAAQCRRLAVAGIDPDIARRLIAMAEDCERDAKQTEGGET